MRLAVPLLLAACSEEIDPEATSQPSELPQVVVPTLTIAAPSRGAFVGDVDRLTMKGKVKKGSGALASLATNEQAIELPAGGGSFSGEVTLEPGVNVLGTRVEADDGGRAVDGRAVYAGKVHAAGDPLSGSMKMQLGPELLDDDEPDLDDLAGLTEALLEDPSFAEAFVGMRMETEYYVLTVTDASLGASDADIVPVDGAVTLSLTIHDVWVAFDIEGTSWYSWLSTSGEAGADAAILETTLRLSADGGSVSATPSATEVTLDGFWVTVEWFPDSLEDDLAEWTREDLEQSIAEQVEEQVGALVEEYLSAFAADFSFSDVDLHIGLDTLRVASDGLRLTLDAWSEGAVAIELPTGAGSLRTDGDGPDFPLGSAPFTVAVDDDFLHQLLFNVWVGGSLHGISMDALTLQALAGEVPPPLGPLHQLDIDLDLPPTLHDATHDGQELDLAIGELRMKLTREDGELIDASVNLRTGATLAFEDDGEVGIALDTRPSYMTLEVGMEDWPDALDPGDMAALMRLTVPPLLSTVGNFVPSIPIPGIPLDGFSDAFAGVELGLTDPTVAREDRWLVLEASIAER